MRLGTAMTFAAGLKGSLNEYELDLLRQRSLPPLRESPARRTRRGGACRFVKAATAMRRIRTGACKRRSRWSSTRSRNLEARDRRCSGSMSRNSISR